MNDFLLEKTKQLLLRRFKNFKITPQIAIITGSGITLFRVKDPVFEIRYSELPTYKEKSMRERANGRMGVKGHEGKLKPYKIKDKDVIVFSGRRHLYEGLSFRDVTANVRLAYKLGVKKLIVTNAAGGINKNFKVGDLMLITGFIDLMQSTERGILSGISQEPKKVQTKLNNTLSEYFRKNLKAGVYAGVLGPSYETYSEIKLLQSLGASAVGMSTVPEIICARNLGMDFAGIAVISNIWNLRHKPSHIEVLKQIKKSNEKLQEMLLKAVLLTF